MLLLKQRFMVFFEGDTYFPDIDLTSFRKVSETFNEKDDKNAYDFTITVLEK